jgi:hypothetical protein
MNIPEHIIPSCIIIDGDPDDANNSENGAYGLMYRLEEDGDRAI